MNQLLVQSRKFIKRNGSTILTIIGGVGSIVTTVTAVKATPKAMTRLEEARSEKGEDLTNLEKVKVAGPVYIPTVAFGVSSLACIFGANMLSRRQQAGLMSAYAMVSSSYKEYKNKVEELYGEEAEQKVREEIAKDKYTGDEKSGYDNKQMFYDEFSERYFESTIEKVQQAEYMINRNLALSGFTCLNEFYDLLGIDEVDGGDEIGWAAYEMVETYWYAWIEFHHREIELHDGTKCISINMEIEPSTDYVEY